MHGDEGGVKWGGLNDVVCVASRGFHLESGVRIRWIGKKSKPKGEAKKGRGGHKAEILIILVGKIEGEFRRRNILQPESFISFMKIKSVSFDGSFTYLYIKVSQNNFFLSFLCLF